MMEFNPLSFMNSSFYEDMDGGDISRDSTIWIMKTVFMKTRQFFGMYLWNYDNVFLKIQSYLDRSSAQ